VREVHSALSKKQTGYTTILKQMQVMAEKGLLARSERFRSHVYEARLPKEQTQRQLAGNLLQRAFEGSAKNLVLGALSAKKVSAAELEEIRRMLDRFEKGTL
jgi:predicted transcriptional regulator